MTARPSEIWIILKCSWDGLKICRVHSYTAVNTGPGRQENVLRREHFDTRLRFSKPIKVHRSAVRKTVSFLVVDNLEGRSNSDSATTARVPLQRSRLFSRRGVLTNICSLSTMSVATRPTDSFPRMAASYSKSASCLRMYPQLTMIRCLARQLQTVP